MIAPRAITLEQLLVHVAREELADAASRGLPFFASVRTLAVALGVSSTSLDRAMGAVRLRAGDNASGLEPWVVERQARGLPRSIQIGKRVERVAAPRADHPDVWKALELSAWAPERFGQVVARARAGQVGETAAPAAVTPLPLPAPVQTDLVAGLGFGRVQGPPARFVAVDVETTGSSKEDRVIEAAFVFFEDGLEVRSLVRRINPQGRAISPFAYRVHGIRDRELVREPTFAQLAPLIRRCIEGKVVVGHNLAYDKRMLTQEFERLGQAWPDTLGEVCTLKRAKKELSTPDHQLPTVCQALGVPGGTHHRAIDDARAAGLVLVALDARQAREVAA